MHNLFYTTAEQIKGDRIIIAKKELHHVKNVLRVKKGDIVFLTDGAGNVYETKVVNLERNKLTGKILAAEYVKRTSKVNLELAFVPLKGSRTEMIIEKCTELGVSRFRPFISKHAVIKDLDKNKIERFQRIALSAMLQSKQYYLPEFMVFESTDALLRTCIGFDLVMLADQQGDPEIPINGSNILYIVGPEGGFDRLEVQSFKNEGVKLLSLGANRLRSETAAITGLVKILTKCGVI